VYLWNFTSLDMFSFPDTQLLTISDVLDFLNPKLTSSL
jgi:hypothetical protein